MTPEAWFYILLLGLGAGVAVLVLLEIREGRRPARQWSEFVHRNGITRVKSGHASHIRERDDVS